MAYLDVKNQFLATLNRRDITPTQTDSFMQMGIQRTQRTLRIPAMEKLVQITVDGTWVNGVPVPGDLLELISIDTGVTSTTPNKLRRVDLKTAALLSQVAGVPEVFSRQSGTYIIGPIPAGGTTININYYANFSTLSADTDSNWATVIAPDLLVYGALTFSSDYFMDERKDAFESRYAQLIEDLNIMATRDELSDSAIRPAVNTDGDYSWDYSW